MKTAVVTDGKYRASLAAVRALGAAGFRVVVTQTKGEAAAAPASFLSRYAAETRWIDGSCKDDTYGQNLLALLGEYDTPVLFCTGADTLNLVSRRREEFAAVSRFLVAPPQVLDDLNDKETMKYIDLTKPYWDQRANADLMIRNKMYYTTGDISLVDNMSTNAILFNKGMRAAYGLEDPYELVRSGDWTLEKFIELARAVGEDANQDGIYDENDVYGLMTWNDATLAVLAAAGEKICSIDENGDLELTFYNERVVNLFDTFAGLYFDYAHTFNYQYSTQAGEARPSAAWDTNRTRMFDSNQALFYFTTLITVSRHRDSETDFGILPFPKFDKSQERYGHVISDYAGQYICVPEMTGDFARAGLVLEELAYQGQKVLTPAYYDQTLIGQYTRDEESTEMLDIIFSSRVYDVGMYYKIGNYRDSLISYSRTHASLSSIYDTALNAANKKIDTINIFFNQLNAAD